MSFGVRLSVALAAMVTALGFSLGLFLYEDYRSLVKRELFATETGIGLLFETKEHLAYAVIALAASATACAFLAPREAPRLRQIAAALFAAAAFLSLVVVVLGLVVASTRSF